MTVYEDLRRELEHAWTADTSADPDNWTAENPAWGQCAVSALVVQDRLGGGLLRTVNEGVSHYMNLTALGEVMDMTRSQFKTWAPDEVVTRTREYVLSFPETRRRYELLKSRLDVGRVFGWSERAQSERATSGAESTSTERDIGPESTQDARGI